MKGVALAVTLLFSSHAFAEKDNVCEKWFLESGVKPNTDDCEMKCMLTMVDMATFVCPNQCESLCKTIVPDKLLLPLSYMKGLTEGDKIVIGKYPQVAVRVYLAKQKADDLTIKVFGKEGRNDESDAFRHFVWSSLLVKEVGEEKAKIFLTAHEQDSRQPKADKNMDVANNDIGIEFAKKVLKSSQSLELDQIEKAGLDALREGKLKVLKPSKAKIPEGYYSK